MVSFLPLPSLARSRECNVHSPSTGRNRELILLRTPLDAGSGSVDSEKDEGGLPDSLGRESPDVGVSILGAGDDPVGIGSPVDRGDELIVLKESKRGGGKSQYRKRERGRRSEVMTRTSPSFLERSCKLPFALQELPCCS